jgi:CMP-N-acetylneuraminic acid synthetase
MVTLAFIPARGGSKGVPRKNLRPIGGRSLLERAVRACVESGVVDRVLVSTEDEEIAEAARRAGADVPFLRPRELASDEAPMAPVLDHGIRAFEAHAGLRVETLVFTEPTVPFRSAAHVRAAVERFHRGDCRSVIAVRPLERKPEFIFTKIAGDRLERYIKEPLASFARRQDMKHLCRLSSGVYVVGRNDFFAHHSLIVEPLGYTEMTATESINIDEEVDLLLAESVADRYGL